MDTEHRTARVGVRLRESERALLEEAAEASMRNLSSFIRHTALTAAREELDEPEDGQPSGQQSKQALGDGTG